MLAQGTNKTFLFLVSFSMAFYPIYWTLWVPCEVLPLRCVALWLLRSELRFAVVVS